MSKGVEIPSGMVDECGQFKEHDQIVECEVTDPRAVRWAIFYQYRMIRGRLLFDDPDQMQGAAQALRRMFQNGVEAAQAHIRGALGL